MIRLRLTIIGIASLFIGIALAEATSPAYFDTGEEFKGPMYKVGVPKDHMVDEEGTSFVTIETDNQKTYTGELAISEALNDEHIRQLQGFILSQAGIYSYIGTSTVSDRNAYQALEWAKLDINGRAHNNHKPAIFHRSKSLLGGFLQHGNQESIS